MNLKATIFALLTIASTLGLPAFALPAACGKCTGEYADGPEGKDLFQKCTAPDGKVRYFTVTGPFEHGCDPRQAVPIKQTGDSQL